MSFSPRVSLGAKIGAGVGLTFGILSVITFLSILGMLVLLLLEVAPSMVFFLEMLSYTAIGSASAVGGFIGGALIKQHTKDSWFSIGIGSGIGTIVGFLGVIGIVMTLGAVLGATGGTAGLVFVGLQVLATLVVTTGIGCLIGGTIAKVTRDSEANHPFSSWDQQEKQESNIISILHHGLTSRNSAANSQLEFAQSPLELNSVLQPPFKLLESLKGRRKEISIPEWHGSMEDEEEFSTDSAMCSTHFLGRSNC